MSILSKQEETECNKPPAGEASLSYWLAEFKDYFPYFLVKLHRVT